MNDRPDTAPSAPPTSTEARAALDSLEADSSRLSRQFVTPRWHGVLVAAAVALPLCALIIPAVHPATVVPWLAIWSPWMFSAYSRTHHQGTGPHRPGRRSRRAKLLTLAVLAVLAVVAVLLKISTLSSWLILLPAAASFLAALMLGRRYDTTVRAEVADPDGAGAGMDRVR